MSNVNNSNQSNAVQTSGGNAVGAAVDFKKFGGDKSLAGISAKDLKTPYLRILQALSPECIKGDPAYIEEARPGLYFNTATKELSEKPQIIIVDIRHEIVVWKPNRGGLVAKFPHSEELLNELTATQQGAKRFTEEGNTINITYTFFCLDAKDPTSLFLYSMSSTEYKYARDWVTRIALRRVNGEVVGLSWYEVWEIFSGIEKNAKGSWFSVQKNPRAIRVVTQAEADGPIAQALKIAEKMDTSFEGSTQGTKEETQF